MDELPQNPTNEKFPLFIVQGLEWTAVSSRGRCRGWHMSMLKDGTGDGWVAWCSVPKQQQFSCCYVLVGGKLVSGLQFSMKGNIQMAVDLFGSFERNGQLRGPTMTWRQSSLISHILKPFHLSSPSRPQMALLPQCKQHFMSSSPSYDQWYHQTD